MIVRFSDKICRSGKALEIISTNAFHFFTNRQIHSTSLGTVETFIALLKRVTKRRRSFDIAGSNAGQKTESTEQLPSGNADSNQFAASFSFFYSIRNGAPLG
jgi:hypothetical protein